MAKKKIVKKSKPKKPVSTKPASITDSINTEIIAAALSSINQPVLLKICRLCEAKDGPFLNIFDADKITAKKIEAVMPFRIAENDDLPHKICFRCSAKVEELYEFIQKCIKTQQSLRKAVNSKAPINNKPRHRELWEEKLNQSNISNDDICDALIKKAMEGIKDIPVNVIEENEAQSTNKITKKILTVVKEKDTPNKIVEDPQEEQDVPLKAIKEFSKGHPIIAKSLRSRSEIKVETKPENIETIPKLLEKDLPIKNDKIRKSIAAESSILVNNVNDEKTMQTNTFSLNDTTKAPELAFNIMDHVSMIKVNGVGVLFQCKICNRNFLKKEVVMSHACAKNGLAKLAGPKNVTVPEPPKIALVKYINTKITTELKKPIKTHNNIINLDDEDDIPLAPKKPKPKIGPASKVRKNNINTEVSNNNQAPVIQNQSNSAVQEAVVQFPSLNSRYKLVPGPNNTFTLVEEKDTASISANKTDSSIAVKPITPKQDIEKNRQTPGARKNTYVKSQENQIVDNPPQVSTDRPYPVGLFKTLPNTCAEKVIQPEPATFTTPAMKKQSYTIVQTGNPSKLLISSKPQNIVEEQPKKRQRKTKHEVKKDETNKQPFSVTLEDTAPPRDPDFFTFINVDPLLQPSYVLPTDNIIQESQISTSSSVLKQSEKEKDNTSKYTCNMCNGSFSREKKLLTHIQSHYSKMDEEDQKRVGKNPRKRKK